jgi:hypothetical protein
MTRSALHTALLVASLLVASAAPSRAETTPALPRYDLNAICHAETATVGSDLHFFDDCLLREEDARGRVETLWATAPAAVRAACARANAEKPPESWRRLATCLTPARP